MKDVFIAETLRSSQDLNRSLLNAGQCVYGYIPFILCSNARAPVAQLTGIQKTQVQIWLDLDAFISSCHNGFSMGLHENMLYHLLRKMSADNCLHLPPSFLYILWHKVQKQALHLAPGNPLQKLLVL